MADQKAGYEAHEDPQCVDDPYSSDNRLPTATLGRVMPWRDWSLVVLLAPYAGVKGEVNDATFVQAVNRLSVGKESPSRLTFGWIPSAPALEHSKSDRLPCRLQLPDERS